MRKWILASFLLVALSVVLAGCGCEHQWVEAGCVTPKTCKLCKEVEGVPYGHIWRDATCVSAQKCAVCGAIEGTALGHTVTQKPTREKSAKCDTCGQVVEAKLGHEWQDATRTSPRRCKRCQETVGDPLSILDIYPEGTLRHDGENFLMNEEDYIYLYTEMKNRYSYIDTLPPFKHFSIGEKDSVYTLTSGQIMRLKLDDYTKQVNRIIIELESDADITEDRMEIYTDNIVYAYLAANGCMDGQAFVDALSDAVKKSDVRNVFSGEYNGVAYRLEIRYHYMSMEIWVQGE